jgi:hypothetical protein
LNERVEDRDAALALRVGDLRKPMFGEPLMADVSQVRFRPFVQPRDARRKGADDRHADDDPRDVHRQVPSVFFFATIRD